MTTLKTQNTAPKGLDTWRSSLLGLDLRWKESVMATDKTAMKTDRRRYERKAGSVSPGSRSKGDAHFSRLRSGRAHRSSRFQRAEGLGAATRKMRMFQRGRTCFLSVWARVACSSLVRGHEPYVADFYWARERCAAFYAEVFVVDDDARRVLRCRRRCHCRLCCHCSFFGRFGV